MINIIEIQNFTFITTIISFVLQFARTVHVSDIHFLNKLVLAANKINYTMKYMEPDPAINL